MLNIKKKLPSMFICITLIFNCLEKPWFLLKSMEHNCIQGVIYAFCFSILYSTNFYHILLASLELNGLKKYFKKFVKLDEFFQKQPKGFKKKRFLIPTF